MDDQELDYLSSAPLIGSAPKTKPQDEQDLPTLKRLQVLLSSQIAMYNTLSMLTTDETEFTVKQQLAINQRVQLHINELKVMVDGVIADIKEKYE